MYHIDFPSGWPYWRWAVSSFGEMECFALFCLEGHSFLSATCSQMIHKKSNDNGYICIYTEGMTTHI